jgi:transcriptional regulator with XRE-family HTH domain
VDVGLPAGSRRRASGLRREEVAALAGMSTDYYARLEQRRGPQPSEQMIMAIARALRLSLDERDHLLRIAGHNAPTRMLRTDHVAPGLMRVFDRLDDTPAMIVSDLAESLAQNRLATALLGDQAAYRGHARSAVYRWFTDLTTRQHYPDRDHDYQSRIQVAALRAAAGLRPDQRASALVGALRAASSEFGEIWDRHEVNVRESDHKTLVHPELGEIEVDCQKLFTDNRAQMLLVFTARPGSEGNEKLQLLSVLGNQQFVS